MNSAVPHKAKIWSRHFITHGAEGLGQGKANGNLEYSSATVSRYLFRDADGSGPLKSMLSLSIGLVD